MSGAASPEKMMAAALDVRPRSAADFLAWERQQPERYEFVNGAVRMMTGGTIDHNRITRNCAEILARQVQGRGCEVFTSDVGVTTPAGNVMCPDVVIVCGDIRGKAIELATPVVVVEVLSGSTAERDHGPKRWAYQKSPSLRHYLLIDQNVPTVEVATRANDGSWRSFAPSRARRESTPGRVRSRPRPGRDLRPGELRDPRRG